MQDDDPIEWDVHGLIGMTVLVAAIVAIMMVAFDVACSGQLLGPMMNMILGG
ncbi:MAG TPA: hypothetical protein VFG44_03965 [Burkholderiales bacterium]|nr:hypothetical protein [Burkholderiales bacterium]